MCTENFYVRNTDEHSLVTFKKKFDDLFSSKLLTFQILLLLNYFLSLKSLYFPPYVKFGNSGSSKSIHTCATLSPAFSHWSSVVDLGLTKIRNCLSA